MYLFNILFILFIELAFYRAEVNCLHSIEWSRSLSTFGSHEFVSVAEQIKAYITPILTKISENEKSYPQDSYLKVVHFKQARTTHAVIVTIDIGCFGKCNAQAIKHNFLYNPTLLGGIGRKSYIGQYQCTERERECHIFKKNVIFLNQKLVTLFLMDQDFTFRYQGKIRHLE